MEKNEPQYYIENGDIKVLLKQQGEWKDLQPGQIDGIFNIHIEFNDEITLNAGKIIGKIPPIYFVRVSIRDKRFESLLSSAQEFVSSHKEELRKSLNNYRFFP